MALATTCPQCKTSFKVVPDQLKLSQGSVRCGVCQNVFSGIDYLRYVDQSALQDPKARQSGADTGPRPSSPASSSQPASGPPATPGASTAQDHPSGSDDLKTAFFLPDSGFGSQVSDALDGAARRPKRDIDFSYLPRMPFSPFVPSDRPESRQRDPTDKTSDSGQHEQSAGAFEAFPNLSLSADSSTDVPADSRSDAISTPGGDATQDADTWQHAADGAVSSRQEGSIADLPVAQIAANEVAPRPATATDFSDLAKSRPRKRQPIAAMMVVGLLIGLLVQALISYRDDIAVRSAAISAVLEPFLENFGLKISPPLDLSVLSIESFELQTGRSKNLLQMTAVLRNRGIHVVAFPAMELTLTDSSGALMSRKVILVESYLDPPLIAARGLARRSEWPIRITLEHDGLEPAGYSVALFYP